MKILFLDDDLNRINFFIEKTYENHDITICKNSERAIFNIKNNRYDLISLDHDLGTETTGFDVAKEICELPLYKIPINIIIHSLNPVGAEKMHNQLLFYFLSNEQFLNNNIKVFRVGFGNPLYWKLFSK